MSRKKRIRRLVIALLVLISSIFALYSIGNLPALTAQMAMCRKEKQELIGPARIIGQEDIDNNDRIYIGRTDYGYTLFEHDPRGNFDSGKLSYFPKAEDVTVFCTQKDYYDADTKSSYVPVFAFPEDRAATRARLTLQAESHTGPYVDSLICEAEAPVSENGYFLFRFDRETTRAYSMLFTALGDRPAQDYSGTVVITLELYDSDENLLKTLVQQCKVAA